MYGKVYVVVYIQSSAEVSQTVMVLWHQSLERETRSAGGYFRIMRSSARMVTHDYYTIHHERSMEKLTKCQKDIGNT